MPKFCLGMLHLSPGENTDNRSQNGDNKHAHRCCGVRYSRQIRKDICTIALNDIESCHSHQRTAGNLPQYYKQADIALRLGSKYEGMRWTHPFEQYALRYVADECTKVLQPETLCIQGLRKLMEYDKEKNRNYTDTLRVYLENNMNVAVTIRKIYMQRATFLYQLKKIEEISGLNLKDYNTRLYLMLSYLLLDKE